MIDNINMNQEAAFQQLNCHKSTGATELLINQIQNGDLQPILLITEPFLLRKRNKNKTKTTMPALSRLRGYDCFSTGQRPRACVLLPKHLKGFQRPDLSDPDITSVLIEDPSSSARTLLVSCYLDITAHQNEVIPNTLRKLHDLAVAEQWRLIIGMDCNSHSTLWGCPKNNTRGDIMEHWLFQTDLIIQNVGTTNTFDTENRGRSIIDITLSTANVDIRNWTVQSNDTQSDHKKITYNSSLNYTTTKVMRNLKQADWPHFIKIMKHYMLPTHETWNANMLEIEAAGLETAIVNALNIACPERTIILGKNPSKKSSAHYGPAEKQLQRKIKQAYNTHRIHGRPQDYIRYKDLRRIQNRNIRTNKNLCWQQYTESIQDIKTFAKTIKGIIGNNNPNIGMLNKPEGSVTNSVAEVAEVLLDKHFPGSTLEQEHSNDIPDIGIEVNFDHETLSFIDTTKLKQAIEQFGPHKANGPDGLKPIVLQNLPESTLEAIVKLFKVSIAIGSTPKTWTRSKVIFLPKSGKDSYAEAGSFRPISLCSYFLKSLERLVLWNIETTTLTVDPLSSAQHAFRRDYSTDTALTAVVNKLEQGLLNQKITLAVYLDISGAFNNLSFDSALSALRRKKIPEHLVTW
jgi:hypothetical protein